MNKKTKALAALIVEDVESDAQLIVRLLKKADYELAYEQVETAEQMRAALEKRTWDIVISDYSLPQFSGENVLAILKEAGQDIPFIIVSGAMGEETAVAMMKAGAHDYLMKGDLARLIPAVERELEQAEVRRERRQAQESLAKSEAELRTLVEHVPAVVYTESAETRETTYISPQVQRLTGYTPVEWIQDRDLWKKMIHSEDLAAVLEKDKHTSATCEPFYAEYRILTRDGRTIWIRDEAAVIENRDGTPLFWQGVMRDITERRQVDEALRESQSLYHSLVESSPLSICRKDPEGRFTFANRRFLELSNITLADLLGKTDFDLHPSGLAEKYRRDDQSILDGGQVRELIEERAIRGGETNFVQSIKTPIYDGSGKINGIQVSFWDITERKQAELELQHRKEDLELINMLNDVINRGESLEVLIDTLNNETKRIYSATTCTVSLLSPDGKIMTIERAAVSPIIVKKIEQLIGQPIPKIHVHVREGGYIYKVLQNEKGTITSDPKLIRQWIVEFAENIITSPVLRALAQKLVPQIYKILNIGSDIAVPLTLGTRVIGLLELAGKDLFTEDVLRRVHNISRQVTSAILRKQAEEGIHRRVTELEMLYQSGLALGQLLTPKEVGRKVLELLEEKLNWRNTRIRLYHPQDDSLELLDFNQQGLKGDVERRQVLERFQFLIAHSNQGMSGWVVQHGQTIRCGDVGSDPRYVEAYPGIQSGLYVPMKLGERVVGVISIEDEQPYAFSEADERLIATLANQAASAFENARLFEETRQRVMELETLNRISLVLRAVTKQNEMLSIVLDEALAILNTSHGSIELYNKTTDSLEKTITRGWMAQVTEHSRKIDEGIASKVFTSGEISISREYASDPEAYAASRSQIPPNWGGICLPIRTTQRTLGVLCVSVPSERELNKNEIRLLSILSEMTGAALQRMQLHEQTVRRLEQLKALRAVDQAISSSRDMRLTLSVLLTHTISQLEVDATDVLLLHPGSNLLELVDGRGFHSPLPEKIRLNDSLALQAIMEHRLISAHDFEVVDRNPHFWKLWKVEGFVCYWCVPLIVKGEFKGVLEVYCRKPLTPDAEWLEFLESLAGQAAIAIDTAQLFENLQRANMDLSLAYDATIEGWSRAMDLRDHETEGHTLRVTDLTMELARAMRVSESQLTAIRRGALLHDIGKMGVPDAILLKEGDLTDEEWVLMRKHPELARDMLMPITYLNDALNIPYCHHEKWDGTGYPQGLKGDQIPLVARIFALVDVWDALTNDRTYRAKWAKQKARQYIKEQSGIHFDPQIVDVFLKHVEKSE